MLWIQKAALQQFPRLVAVTTKDMQCASSTSNSEVRSSTMTCNRTVRL